MKKILFGIMLIVLSTALMQLWNVNGIQLHGGGMRNDILICHCLLVCGFMISVWGLFEKD